MQLPSFSLFVFVLTKLSLCFISIEIISNDDNIFVNTKVVGRVGGWFLRKVPVAARLNKQVEGHWFRWNFNWLSFQVIRVTNQSKRLIKDIWVVCAVSKRNKNCFEPFGVTWTKRRRKFTFIVIPATYDCFEKSNKRAKAPTRINISENLVFSLSCCNLIKQEA